MAASLVSSFWRCATKSGSKSNNNVMERLGVATLNVLDEWDGASLSSILHHAANLGYDDTQVLKHLERRAVSNVAKQPCHRHASPQISYKR